MKREHKLLASPNILTVKNGIKYSLYVANKINDTDMYTIQQDLTIFLLLLTTLIKIWTLSVDIFYNTPIYI